MLWESFWGSSASNNNKQAVPQTSEPARRMHIVPQVKDSLLGTGKCLDADSIAIYDKHEVNYFDAKTTKVIITDTAVLTGWHCPKTNLWQVPLIGHPTNFNVNTIILDHPSKLKKLNSLYNVQTTQAICTRIHILQSAGTSNRAYARNLPDESHQQRI